MTMHNVEHLTICRHQLVRFLVTSITGVRYYLCEICRSLINTEGRKLTKTVTIPYYTGTVQVDDSGRVTRIRRVIERTQLNPGDFTLRPLASSVRYD